MKFVHTMRSNLGQNPSKLNNLSMNSSQNQEVLIQFFTVVTKNLISLTGTGTIFPVPPFSLDQV